MTNPLLLLEKQLKRRIDRAEGDVRAWAKLNKIELSKKTVRYAALDSIYDELPDGAYFAAMDEHGFDADGIIRHNEILNGKGYYDTREAVH